jgi:hypothetical protein
MMLGTIYSSLITFSVIDIGWLHTFRLIISVFVVICVCAFAVHLILN